MDIFGAGAGPRFHDFVQGTWGSFVTPAGRVEYIMTKARLGDESPDPARRLTKSLAPVREVMDAEDLDFNQLLQRDLDDHRVATNLIPYLLRKRATGPAFFPPVVAVLLPFKNKHPSTLPELGNEEYVEGPDGRWLQTTAGEAMRVRRLAEEGGKLHPIPLGQLHWNEAYARLVVIDGQHRAMALLAIERTQSNTWDQSGGERFKSFYEVPVKRELDYWRNQDGGILDLSRVEIPVTVCWFPEQTGPAGDSHSVARKLFVDVNKEARQPSESRLILLSDGELLKVLTRSLLNELRSQSTSQLLPLYAIEYDNPEPKTTQSARWSAMTNIHLLQMAVERCIFGPPKYITRVDLTFGGRESETERDTFMRNQLELAELFSPSIKDGDFTYLFGDIGNANFPIGRVDDIVGRFKSSWGEAILVLLSEVAHYRAHYQALTRIKDQWAPGDILARLAHDALFGGVGVYWTLRDSSEHFKRESTLPGMSSRRTKPDIVKAWDYLQGKQDAFEKERAKELLGSEGDESVKRSIEVYAMMNTHACQLGMTLTLASLWKLHVKNRASTEIPDFARSLASAWNAYFLQEKWLGKARDRRKVFAKRKISNPLNGIMSMDTPQAVYFRYFWMEILASEAAWPIISEWIDSRENFEETLGIARFLYRELLVKQQDRALKNSEPGIPDKQRRRQAEQHADNFLKSALDTWLDVPAIRYDDWLRGAKAATVEPDTGDPQEDSTEYAVTTYDLPANLDEIFDGEASDDE